MIPYLVPPMVEKCSNLPIYEVEAGNPALQSLYPTLEHKLTRTKKTRSEQGHFSILSTLLEGKGPATQNS